MEYCWCLKGESLLKQIRETDCPEGQLAIWRIGQNGVILKYRGRVLYIDPVLSEMLDSEGRSFRNFEPPFPPESVEQADYVLCSHGHPDHIQIETLLPMARRNTGLKILVPACEREKLIESGIREEQLTTVGREEIFLSGIRIHPIPVAHEKYEYDEAGNPKCLGFLLELGVFSIFYAGDAVVTEELIQEVKKASHIDLALLPINGIDSGRSREGIQGNMNARDAAWLSQEIGAELVIPLHYDLIRGNTENPLHFAEYMQSLYPGRRYRVLGLGERFILMK